MIYSEPIFKPGKQMPYYYEKNGQIHTTDSIDNLIYHSFPIDIQSPAKIAHYKAVAPIIFSSQYKLSAPTTREEISLGEDFIEFITHHKLSSLKNYNGVDLLYLLSLSHDSALRAGVWELGSSLHLEATEIINNLSTLNASDRIPLMNKSLRTWKGLFLSAKLELQNQEAAASPDSTRNMLSQMSSHNTYHSQSQSGQGLEIEQEQFRLLERAHFKKEQERRNRRTEIQSPYNEEEEYYVPQQQQYSYN